MQGRLLMCNSAVYWLSRECVVISVVVYYTWLPLVCHRSVPFPVREPKLNLTCGIIHPNATRYSIQNVPTLPISLLFWRSP